MVELVYTQDLKSCGLWPCGFDPRSWYAFVRSAFFFIGLMVYGSISVLDVVACIGSCTAVLSLVPQIIHSYKTKSVDDISILMLLNLTVSSISWTMYGIMIHDMPILWTNVLLGLGSCIMLIFKKKYRSKR